MQFGPLRGTVQLYLNSTNRQDALSGGCACTPATEQRATTLPAIQATGGGCFVMALRRALPQHLAPVWLGSAIHEATSHGLHRCPQLFSHTGILCQALQASAPP